MGGPGASTRATSTFVAFMVQVDHRLVEHGPQRHGRHEGEDEADLAGLLPGQPLGKVCDAQRVRGIREYGGDGFLLTARQERGLSCGHRDGLMSDPRLQHAAINVANGACGYEAMTYAMPTPDHGPF